MEYIKELQTCKIGKVKMKDDSLTVEYTEEYTTANYINKITNSCAQLVHNDLKRAFNLLKPHVVKICEMPESEQVAIEYPLEDEYNDEELNNYVVTGYVRGGTGEYEGVTIIAQKLLKCGKTLNLVVPFIKFSPENNDYPYSDELKCVIDMCDYEVDAYLFDNKWGVRQQDLFGFDGEANITEVEFEDECAIKS